MSRTVENPPAAPAVEVVGAPSSEEREYAVEKIGSLSRYAPIRSARVAMQMVGDPLDPQWAEARVNLNGDRLFVHAGARGSSMHEAVNVVRQRLYQMLTHQRHRSHRATTRSASRRRDQSD
jgi:ribosome-associated translation inhibitor RaiA